MVIRSEIRIVDSTGQRTKRTKLVMFFAQKYYTRQPLLKRCKRAINI
jgi:hypothetical protein